jgi:hypothetical protein
MEKGMNRKQQVARVQFCVAVHLRKVEGKKMEMVVFIVYCVLSYWAVGQTIYANKIQIGSMKDIFLTRFVLGVLLGLILIPVAILKKLFIH